MSDKVLLIHGLWMGSWTMLGLGRRLAAEGFEVERFDYPTVHRSLDETHLALAERAAQLGPGTHFVCHSLGGLVTLSLLQKNPALTRGRIVCLGSPLGGSAVARSLGTWPGGRWMMGKSFDLLVDGLAEISGPQQVGSLAGRLPLGLGRLLGGLSDPHDGTVSAAETQLPGLADHALVPASHSGLLFSDHAAGMVARFLREGRFQPD